MEGYALTTWNGGPISSKVPVADSDANAWERDVIGSKEDTVDGDSLISIAKSILANETEGDSHVPLFAGDVYYVDASQTDDTGDGTTPGTAKKTINAAIALLSLGDAVTIKAGTYAENVVLDVGSCELWFELGAIIAPATGICLSITVSYCRVTCEGGALRLNADAAEQVGLYIPAGGAWAYVNEVRAYCASGGDLGFQIEGNGCDLRRCRASSPMIAAFKISGDKVKLEDCCTGGIPANGSIGFWFTDSCDKFRLKNSGSQGHDEGSFKVDTGCTNGVIENFYSGGGDGKWTDTDSSTVISKMSYQETKYASATLDASTNYKLFVVKGAVEILEIFGHVTTILGGANTEVYFDLWADSGGGGTSDPITAITGTDLGTAAVSTVVMKTENPGKKVTVFAGGAPTVDKGTDPKKKACVVNASNANTTYIRWNVTANDTSGVMHFHIMWRPLTDDGFVSVYVAP